MSTSSQLTERQLLMAGYILGDLDLEESRAFEKLRLEDPNLPQELVQLQSSLERVYGPEETPPPALKASVLEQAGRHLAHLDTVETSPEQSVVSDEITTNFANKIVWLISGLLVALSCYLGIQNHSLRQAMQARQADVANADQSAQGERTGQSASYVLTATENATARFETSSVELVVGTDRTKATIRAAGLPVLANDQTYVLWTVTAENAPATTDDKGAILTAVFDVDETGAHAEEIVLPSIFRNPTQVEKIAITVEDAEAPQNHEASPVLIYQL